MNYPIDPRGGGFLGFTCCPGKTGAITSNTKFILPDSMEYNLPYTPMLDYPALSQSYFYPPFPVVPKFGSTITYDPNAYEILPSFNAPNPNKVNRYTSSVIPGVQDPGYYYLQGLK